MHTATLLSFQDELEKIAFTLGSLPPTGAAIGATVGAIHGMARPGKDSNGKQKSRAGAALKKGAVGGAIGSIALPAGVIAAIAGKEALSKLGSHAAELAGLGILAVPSIQHLRGKEMSEKNKSRAEIGGLGVLAAPSALAVGKAGLSKLKGLASKMPKHAGLISNGGFTPHDVKQLKGVGKAALSGGAKALALGGAAYLGAKAGSKKKEAAPSMSAMMNMHRLADSAKAAKNVAKPAAAAAVKLPNQAAQAARASSLANHTAVGGHAWNPAAQAKRAIPL